MLGVCVKARLLGAKDVVNQCLEFVSRLDYGGPSFQENGDEFRADLKTQLLSSQVFHLTTHTTWYCVNWWNRWFRCELHTHHVALC